MRRETTSAAPGEKCDTFDTGLLFFITFLETIDVDGLIGARGRPSPRFEGECHVVLDCKVRASES